MLTIRVNPYHDEGGPALLTAFFSQMDPTDPWALDAIVMLFDTTYQMIWTDGNYTSMPDVRAFREGF
jgi:hypothetical protein